MSVTKNSGLMQKKKKKKKKQSHGRTNVEGLLDLFITLMVLIVTFHPNFLKPHWF
jgi:competence protein ComGC